jgi:hypothetical protein
VKIEAMGDGLRSQLPTTLRRIVAETLLPAVPRRSRSWTAWSASHEVAS